MKDPSKRIAACEEFFMLVLEAHVLVACMTVFKMASVEDTSSQELIPGETAAQDDAIRRDTMLEAVKSVLDECICVYLLQRTILSKRCKTMSRNMLVMF